MNRKWASLSVMLAATFALCLAPYGVGQGKGNGGGGGGGGGGGTPPPNPEIAYVNWQSGNICVMNADGTNARAVFPQVSGEIYYHPTWSPDGRSIAYSEFNGNYGIGRIWAVDVDGSNRRLLAETSYWFQRVDWGTRPAPDGERKLCFVQRFPTAGGSMQYDVFLMNEDGTGLVNVTNTPGDTPADNEFGPFWIGDKLAFFRSGSLVVATLGLAGGQVVVASEEIISGGPYGTGRAAHNHPWIVFAVDSVGLFVANLDTLETRQITSGRDAWPCFSPNDTKIVFSRAGSNTWNAYTVNVDGSGLTKIMSRANMSDWKKPDPSPPPSK
jgi:Tol biopolymer transport system component